MKRNERKNAHPDEWETLSGRVEIGEEPLECAIREIREATNLVVGEHVQLDSRPITSYQTTRLDDAMIMLVYRAQYLDGDILMSEEHSAYAWLPWEEFAKRSNLKELVYATEMTLKI